MLLRQMKGRIFRKLQQEFTKSQKRYWAKHFWSNECVGFQFPVKLASTTFSAGQFIQYFIKKYQICLTRSVNLKPN